ncbi:MAG: squalene synthase HpnC [Acidobacteriota bacterium]
MDIRLRPAYDQCRQIAASHYENFPVSSWLVPRGLRPHFHAVYAFCRISDDLGDEGEVGGRTEALSMWESDLKGALSGEAHGPVLAAVANTAAEFHITHDLFFNLLRAFKQDQVKSEYASEQELLDYCRFSANPVGRIVLHLIGAATPENALDSDSICTGLQLANFAQDVARDLANNRIYIPSDEMRDAGYTPSDLRSGIQNAAFAAVMERQVSRARTFLQLGLPLARRLPARIGLEIRAIAHGGLRVLELIERIGYGVLGRRPALGRKDYAVILARILR